VSAESLGRGVEGHVVMRGCMVVPLMLGMGSWRLRNGLKLVASNMAVVGKR
jgi:hypothetical protein